MAAKKTSVCSKEGKVLVIVHKEKNTPTHSTAETKSKAQSAGEAPDPLPYLCMCDGPATQYCYHCDVYLCSECQGDHVRRQPMSRQCLIGKIVNKYKQSNNHCVYHEHEPINVFCNTCKQVVCHLCVSNKHNEHKLGFIKDNIQKIKDTCLCELKHMQPEFDQMKSRKTNLDREKTAAINSHKIAIDTMKQRKDNLIDMITTIADTEISRLENSQESVTTSYDTFARELNKAIATCEQDATNVVPTVLGNEPSDIALSLQKLHCNAQTAKDVLTKHGEINGISTVTIEEGTGKMETARAGINSCFMYTTK